MNLKRALKVKDELQRVQDMAISRDAYVLLCLSNFSQFFKNLAKICSFDDIGLQKHWGSEAITKLQDVLVVKLKKDNKKTQYEKRKAFIENFIQGYMGENYEEYNYVDKREWFISAIESEGYNANDFDIENIINSNRDRVIRLFESLKTVSFTSSREDLINIMNDFICDN